LAIVVLPGGALGAGPLQVADGEPDNDTRLSVLTPAEQAFVQKKLAFAATVGTTRTTAPRRTDQLVPSYACESDPCEGTPPPPPGSPPPPPLPTAKTLATKARQQNNYYFCGPASGQVVINWTRGFTSGSFNGEDATTNWRRQSKIADWMSTTTAGTGGANLANGLNNPGAVLKPTADWIYSYADIGTMQQLYGKIVTDVATYGMPLVLATAPHVSGAGQNFLESWAGYVGPAHHWIVVRGYVGAWGDPTPILIQYQDSSGSYGGSTGSFDDRLSVVWQVSKWNQGGHVVW
jgi:hypothetical protein